MQIELVFPRLHKQVLIDIFEDPFKRSYFFLLSLAMSCPGGSIYQSCGTRCPSTCVSNSTATSCSLLPVEGCFCKEGYILSGDTCVPESSCGCVDEENQYHQASYYRHFLKKEVKEQGISIVITVRKKEIYINNTSTIIIYTVNNSKIDSLWESSWSVSCVIIYITYIQMLVIWLSFMILPAYLTYGIYFYFFFFSLSWVKAGSPVIPAMNAAPAMLKTKLYAHPGSVEYERNAVSRMVCWAVIPMVSPPRKFCESLSIP